jgi:hypothetical protein
VALGLKVGYNPCGLRYPQGVPTKVFAPSPPRSRVNKVWGMTVSEPEIRHSSGWPPPKKNCEIHSSMTRYACEQRGTFGAFFARTCASHTCRFVCPLERKDRFDGKCCDICIDVSTNFSQHTYVGCNGITGAEGDFGEFGGAVCVETTITHRCAYFF